MGLFTWFKKRKILSKSEYEYKLKNVVDDPKELKLRSFIYCILVTNDNILQSNKSDEQIVEGNIISIEEERTKYEIPIYWFDNILAEVLNDLGIYNQERFYFLTTYLEHSMCYRMYTGESEMGSKDMTIKCHKCNKIYGYLLDKCPKCGNISNASS